MLIKNLVLLKGLSSHRVLHEFPQTVGTKTVLMYCYVDDLKQWLISVWAEFKHSVIDKAIDQWQPGISLSLLIWADCCSSGAR